MIELKQLGDTGVMVPEIGLGTWKYRGGVEPLRRGIELGAYLIDTAEIYRTENVVVVKIRHQLLVEIGFVGRQAVHRALHQIGHAQAMDALSNQSPDPLGR